MTSFRRTRREFGFAQFAAQQLLRHVLELAVRPGPRIRGRARLRTEAAVVAMFGTEDDAVDMRYKVVVTRVETVERWVPAADEDSAVLKVEEELRRPFAFVGQWETRAAEVRVVEAAQSSVIQPTGSTDPSVRLLGLKDAARSLGISYSTLYNLVRQGEVEHTKVGSRYFMSRESIDAFIRTNTTSK